MYYILNLIIILIIINYGFKLVFRYILPRVVKNQFEKMAGGFNNGQNPFEQYQQQEKSDEKVISVKNAPEENENSISNNAGDYIEFEDVKE